MNKHDKLQLNGVCWDCGRERAEPEIVFSEVTGGARKIGWKCTCGRWWPVFAEDLAHWVGRVHMGFCVRVLADLYDDFKRPVIKRVR